MSKHNTAKDELLELFSANFNDGEPIATRVGSKDTWRADSIVEFIIDFAAPYAEGKKHKAVVKIRPLTLDKFKLSYEPVGEDGNKHRLIFKKLRAKRRPKK